MLYRWGYWQMRYAIKPLGGLAALLLLASCSHGDRVETNVAAPAVGPAVADTPVKLGAAYQVGNTTYVPVDVANYDEVGYASWYGAELQGRNTANGEIFISSAITGAHKTLPMPSYVEVTELDSGRTILVRVNDRGPFANDRLIDLSEGAARELGIAGQGVAGVRVRRVNPPEQDRAMLRSGRNAQTRLDTPESLLKVLREKLSKLPRPSGAAAVAPPPSPVASAPSSGSAPRATPRPVPAQARSDDDGFVREGASTARPAAPRPPVPAAVAIGGEYVVQIGSFSSRSRADDLAKRSGARVAVSADGRLFRVRYGPYAKEADAARALSDAQKRGYPQAKLLRE
jgi:rare lipoprotein A